MASDIETESAVAPRVKKLRSGRPPELHGPLKLIVVAAANYRPSRRIEMLKSAEEQQRHGFRWFLDGS
jgi:hypothetical protein